jgi:hypothetical protein
VTKYLFVFGYESPEEWQCNAEQGTDYESSNAVWVTASSKEIALLAGRRFAKDWVRQLFDLLEFLSMKGGMPGTLHTGSKSNHLRNSLALIWIVSR